MSGITKKELEVLAYLGDAHRAFLELDPNNQVDLFEQSLRILETIVCARVGHRDLSRMVDKIDKGITNE